MDNGQLHKLLPKGLRGTKCVAKNSKLVCSRCSCLSVLERTLRNVCQLSVPSFHQGNALIVHSSEAATASTG
jgi:hypothetical protein